jgi:hypothetical protein
MWNRSANSEDQVHQLASCSRMWMVCSPACILTSSTSTSMSSGLARASWTSMELFEMDMHQLQQAAAMVMLSDINTNAQQQCSIKEMASKLETGSSSSVAVGERAARTTVEHACSHRRRHERHERRVQRHLPSRAILLSYLSLYRSSSGLLFLFVRGDAGAAMQ